MDYPTRVLICIKPNDNTRLLYKLVARLVHARSSVLKSKIFVTDQMWQTVQGKARRVSYTFVLTISRVES